jgi:hypothetical protein
MSTQKPAVTEDLVHSLMALPYANEMEETPLSQLAQWPVDELRRRARILSALFETDPVTLSGCEFVLCANGAGDDASWLFVDDGRVLLLVFDHESVLNLYAENDVAAQFRMYEGVPDDLLALVRGLPEGCPFLMLGKGTEAMPIASGVFWFDGSIWRPSLGLISLVEERHLDLFDDSGFEHCTGWCLLDQVYTPEALIEEDAEYVFGFNLDEIKALFASQAEVNAQGQV